MHPSPPALRIEKLSSWSDARRERHADSRLIIPGPGGETSGHFLRMLQRRFRLLPTHSPGNDQLRDSLQLLPTLVLLFQTASNAFLRLRTTRDSRRIAVKILCLQSRISKLLNALELSGNKCRSLKM